MVRGLGDGYSSYCVIYVRPLGSNEVRILYVGVEFEHDASWSSDTCVSTTMYNICR